MKALSLWQPWATLLVSGKKRVETRGWPTTHRGPLLIHAAKTWNRDLSRISIEPVFLKALREIEAYQNDRRFPLPCGFPQPAVPFGAIVGRVNVVECVPTHSVAVKGKPDSDPGFFEGWIDSVLARHLIINETEKAFGDYGPGRFAWLCSDFERFDTPIPCRGAQQLFEVDLDEIKKKAK